MLYALTQKLSGPFGAAEIKAVFQSIFRASLDIQDRERRRGLKVLGRDLVPPGGIRVRDVAIGDGQPVLITGPCSVETTEQMETIAEVMDADTDNQIMHRGA